MEARAGIEMGRGTLTQGKQRAEAQDDAIADALAQSWFRHAVRWCAFSRGEEGRQWGKSRSEETNSGSSRESRRDPLSREPRHICIRPSPPHRGRPQLPQAGYGMKLPLSHTPELYLHFAACCTGLGPSSGQDRISVPPLSRSRIWTQGWIPSPGWPSPKTGGSVEHPPCVHAQQPAIAPEV
jgi:hypothetical protein